MADPCAQGGAPFVFIDGTPTSTLGFTFGGLADAGDDVQFSNNGGVSFAYTPAPNANGVDSAVTHLRFNPQGPFSGTTTGNPSFQVRFRVRVE